MSLFEGGRVGSSNDMGQIGLMSVYGRNGFYIGGRVVKKQVLEDRVWIGVVCVCRWSRQGSRESCDVWLCGLSGRIVFNTVRDWEPV